MVGGGIAFRGGSLGGGVKTRFPTALHVFGVLHICAICANCAFPNCQKRHFRVQKTGANCSHFARFFWHFGVLIIRQIGEFFSGRNGEMVLKSAKSHFFDIPKNTDFWRFLTPPKNVIFWHFLTFLEKSRFSGFSISKNSGKNILQKNFLQKNIFFFRNFFPKKKISHKKFFRKKFLKIFFQKIFF